MKLIGFILIALSLSCAVAAQQSNLKKLAGYGIHEGDYLTAEFHARRRQALRDSMPPNTVVVLFAGPEHYRSHDIKHEYHQDPNFFYLTGLREPHALLVLFKYERTIAGIKTDEVLFLPRKNDREEQWEGVRLGIEGAKEILEFKSVFPSDSFPDWEFDFNRFDDIYCIAPPPQMHDDLRNQGDLASLVSHFAIKLGAAKAKLNEPQLHYWLAGMREIKEAEELMLIRKAITMTCEGLNELMRGLEPNMREYQAEAIVEFWFKNEGAESTGYPSIMGGGQNSCYLHYSSNRKMLEGKHLLLCDVGAEFHGYTADVTRTLPVDGHFSEEEKAIYELVLIAQNAGIEQCRVGNKFWGPDKAAKDVLAQGLKSLGIITGSSDVKHYFFHGTSHYMGLDVHDSGLRGFLKAGNVITVEPGIYIPEGSDCDPKWWNIGIRIEDDILITPAGPENLSISSPRTVAEIEALMAKESLFNLINDQ
jgi:Xaa-Pro aminopeptidase